MVTTAGTLSGRVTVEEDRPDVAFYCVADERYFLGAVGLINSLRLVGHDEPIFLLDCGLTAASASCSQPQVTLVAGRGETRRPGC